MYAIRSYYVEIKQGENDNSYMCNINYRGAIGANKFSLNKKDIEAIKVQLIADPNIECNALIGIVKPNFR